METVCVGKQWNVALAFAKDGSVTGALPYLIGSKFGLRYVVQPQLTQYNGPWYNYPDGLNTRRRLRFQYDVDGQLIAHLKGLKLAFFSQNFSPSATNWLPFHWAGFKQMTRYTYRFDPIPDKESLMNLMSKRDRQKKILSFMDSLSEDFSVSPTEFTNFYMNYWKRRGKRCLLTPDFVKNLCETALSRGNAFIVGLRDRGSNELMGAKFVVFDSSCAYSLMSAFLRGHDFAAVSSCLVWAAINRASNLAHAYDFEGSMDKGIEYFYRSFGADPVPYHHVWKSFNPLVRFFLEHRISR